MKTTWIVGDRHLVSERGTYSRWVIESVVVEVSPSGEYVNLSGIGWCTADSHVSVEVLPKKGLPHAD